MGGAPIREAQRQLEAMRLGGQAGIPSATRVNATPPGADDINTSTKKMVLEAMDEINAKVAALYQITDAMVEAAAKAFYDAQITTGYRVLATDWAELSDRDRDKWLRSARKALEAANKVRSERP